VWQIISLLEENSYKSLKQVVTHISQLSRADQTLQITCHFLKGARFHEQAFRDRWKKIDGRPFTLNAPVHYYLEVRETAYRLGKIVVLNHITPTYPPLNVVLVLQNPRTRYEIADFIRLGIMFNCPIRLTCDNQPAAVVLALLQHAKAIMKGWQKTQIEVLPTLAEAIQDTIPLGFSLWSHKNEYTLFQYLQQLFDTSISEPHPGLPPLALVFGNEQEGLSLQARKLLPQRVHLGPPSSEPLRASHAAAYVLGILALIREWRAPSSNK